MRVWVVSFFGGVWSVGCIYFKGVWSVVFNRSWECMEYGCGGVSSLEVCGV